MCLVLCLWLYLLVGNLWFPYSRSSCADNSLDQSLQIISSVSEVWGVCIHSLYKFHVFSVQCMIIHINVCDIERSSGFLVSIFKLPAERTTASLSISIRQSVAPILRFHLAPRELPSLSRHEGGSSHRARDGRALFFSRKYIFHKHGKYNEIKAQATPQRMDPHSLFGSLR